MWSWLAKVLVVGSGGSRSGPWKMQSLEVVLVVVVVVGSGRLPKVGSYEVRRQTSIPITIDSDPPIDSDHHWFRPSSVPTTTISAAAFPTKQSRLPLPAVSSHSLQLDKVK
jgi:hypothetical protein